jgi:hypothetical protein
MSTGSHTKLDIDEIRGNGLKSGAPLVAVLGTALPSLALLVVPGLFFYGLRCYDNCDGPPYTRGWAYDPNAWQWQLQFWGMAVPGTAAGFLVIWFLARHRPGWATAALLSAALLYAGNALFIVTGGGSLSAPSSYWLSHPVMWLPYTTLLVGGVISIWIERRWLRALMAKAGGRK